MFAYLKDRVWKKIQRWKEKLLSKAGKEISIKAVAQAIPTYAMSCFDLTKLLCDEISAIICRFWWAQQDNEKKLHRISWRTISSRKRERGLGYRDLHLFNLAMLGR
jgi:hypothetical protein